MGKRKPGPVPTAGDKDVLYTWIAAPRKQAMERLAKRHDRSTTREVVAAVKAWIKSHESELPAELVAELRKLEDAE